ncbi:hypothetical protein, conserved [Plasmodium gonderi]|uniref:S1 motif domain-containing protein n=1 Tax=Plasmodium gonderi TaxID=77519 RepID=A0A1Y1JBP6_PLAGO|nr:hypothetical protein, conserved [Plasmodium gonderi]GAW79098.1 hypothetical protein, conserved [Plasmodium gonderi]
MLSPFTIFFVLHLVSSVSLNVAHKNSFINGSFENVLKCTRFQSRRRRKKHFQSNNSATHTQSNVIFKQITERDYPFRKYNIGDLFYGRILSMNKKNVKLDILCDRKAYLNTSEYFRSPILHKYIFVLLKIHNIIRVKIKYIQKIHQKITVHIQKYSYDEILSSFKNDYNLINARILDVKGNHLLLYLAPKIHAKLPLPHGGERIERFKSGNDILVKIDCFDKEREELYVKLP